MKVSFWITSTTREITEENWGKVPLGGAEISAVDLGQQFLKNGIEVTYYFQRCVPFRDGNLSVKFQNDAVNDIHDIAICIRPFPMILRMNARKKIIWSGDAYDQSSNDMFWNEDAAKAIDIYVFKSEWQKRKILEKYFTIPKERTYVIYNAVNEKLFKDLPSPKRNRFIHASTWYRGLHNFYNIWPKILETIPDAEIHVFSKTSLYFEMNPKDIKYYKIAEDLVKIPGIILREPVPQDILIKEIAKSWLMLYPNTGFVESSCGVALQSICAGTPIVTTNRAGLPETVGTEGILIDETEDWKDKFVEGTLKLWENESERQKKSQKGKSRLKRSSWKAVSREWIDFLSSL